MMMMLRRIARCIKEVIWLLCCGVLRGCAETSSRVDVLQM